jgi:tetratricopeptide (TPR) repeat protein
LDAARTLYCAAIAALKTQAEAQPDNAKLLLQLAHAFDYAGASASAAGDLDAASALHQEALSILDALAKNGNDTQQEQAYTLDHLACALSLAGQEQDAFAIFKRALDIRSALLVMMPENRRMQRDLSVSFDFMADSLMRGGDGSLEGNACRKQALEYYARALEIAEKLCSFDPPNLTYQRDFSISLNKLGDMHAREGEHAAALECYRKALVVRENMLAQDKENTTLWFDRSTSHNKVGDALAELDKEDESLRHYQDALRIRRKLCADMPGNANYSYGQALCLEKIANIYMKKKCFEEATHTITTAHGLLNDLIRELEVMLNRAISNRCREMMARLAQIEQSCLCNPYV